MKVVHVNTFDLKGGAARAAFRVHQGLVELGCDSSMFVLESTSEFPGIKQFVPPGNLLSRVKRRLRRDWIRNDFAEYRSCRPPGFEPFQDSRSPHGNDVVKQLPECDVVNLHWIAEAFVDYAAFFASVPKRTPVVWTLHDMSALTGGCHYDLGCGRFTRQCGACPQLGSNDAHDLSRRIWTDKRAAFDQVDASRLHFVAPSRWLALEVERSSLCRRFGVTVIPYGLDLDTFSARDRVHSRHVLGLPESAKVILFLADGLDNRRKGFSLLVEALEGLQNAENLVLLSVGRNHADCKLKVPWMHLGPLNNDRILSLVYSAADLFVIPSLQDNLPNTVIESMACGTPVVGFAVGGIPDMVRPGLTGTLVEAENVAALRFALQELLNNPTLLAEMSSNCRRVVEEEYTLELQARRYFDLYSTLIRKGHHAPSAGKPTGDMALRERVANGKQI